LNQFLIQFQGVVDFLQTYVSIFIMTSKKSNLDRSNFLLESAYLYQLAILNQTLFDLVSCGFLLSLNIVFVCLSDYNMFGYLAFLYVEQC
jgi:hypothetical protein